MNKIVPLHVVSGYTFLKSGLTIKRIEKSLNEMNYYGLGICDENVLFGLPEFVHMMMDNKKPYVLGMSFVIDEHYLSVFANSEIGYRNLIKISNSLQKEEFTFNSLKELGNGLIGILDTSQGYFLNSLSEDISFTKVIAGISHYFDDFYLGLDIKSKEEFKYAKRVRKFADKFTYLTIAFPKIAYQKKDDAIVLKIVNAIKEGSTLEEKEAIGQEYFMKEEDYAKIYTSLEMTRTIEVTNKCQFPFIAKRGEIYHYYQKDSENELKKRAFAALKEKNKDEDPKYITRLNYELDVINSMGYADYFMLVQDYVNWSKNNDILVGSGRGSAAGSLVSYLLNITEIDPLEYDLLFERFLNVDRKTMPDIDVDFMDYRREDVVEYLRQRFGRHNVANIIAFQTIKAKQALRDIARVYNYPERHVVLLNKRLTGKDYSLGQSYRYIEEFKKLVDSDEYFKEFVSLAGKIEGLPRQSGQHAAGVIINQDPLEDSLPVTIDFNDNLICQYESKYLEEQNYLKMDILGLRNLSTVSVCVDLINEHYPDVHLDKHNIPYKEKEIFDLISSGQVIGLFQIETTAMKNGISILKPKNFDDVVALLALNRPGPREFMSSFARRRDGKEKITYPSESIKDILAPTYGIIVYQEQISQIAIKMASFTPGEADSFRRAISKKDPNIIKQNKDKFIQGSIKNGNTPKASEHVFSMIEAFAKYGFNKAHSVTYAILTCQMAYLKSHYPLEFYSSLLKTNSSNDTKFSEYVSEMRRRNLKIYLPSINESTLTFLCKKDGLLFPLNAIAQIHDIFVEKIIEEREKNGLFKDYFDFALRMSDKGLSESSLEKLIDSGSLDCFNLSRATLRMNMKKALQYAEINKKVDGQVVLDMPLFGKPTLTEAKTNPLEDIEKEYQALGIMISDSPLRYHQESFKQKGVISINEAKEKNDATIAGILKEKKIIQTKSGKSMAFIKLYDESDEIELTLFSSLYDEVIPLLEKNKILVVKIRKDNRTDRISYIAETIEQVEKIVNE